MRNSLLAAFGLALTVAVAVPASAQMSGSMHHDDRKDDNRKGQPAKKAAPAIHKDQYGSWNSGWGARPGAAPSFWNKKGDWYRHVRACQIKYRSYNARTDTYRVGKKALRCRL